MVSSWPKMAARVLAATSTFRQEAHRREKRQKEDLQRPFGSVVKNPPASAGDALRSLGRKDPLEKEMATYSSILAWEIPWTEEPGRLQSIGSQESDRLRD